MDTKGSLLNSLLNSELVTYAWVLVISLWGGMVSFFDKKVAFSWARLFAHLSSSSFAGMMTFMLCDYANVPGPLTGVFCGVAAHMGTPALIKLAMKSKVVKRLLDEGIETDRK